MKFLIKTALLIILNGPLLAQSMDSISEDSSNQLSKHHKHKHKHRHEQTGATGPTGPTGPIGLTGPTGAAGAAGQSGLGIETVYFSMSLQEVPSNLPSFAFIPIAGSGGTASAFDPTTTVKQNFFYSAFLVPFDGTISAFTVRTDVAVTDQGQANPVTPTFNFTVYTSPSMFSNPVVPNPGWTATPLVNNIGPLSIPIGASATASAQKSIGYDYRNSWQYNNSCNYCEWVLMVFHLGFNYNQPIFLHLLHTCQMH